MANVEGNINSGETMTFRKTISLYNITHGTIRENGRKNGYNRAYLILT